MTFPTLTAFYGSILALIYVGLAGWVVAGRVADDTLHGQGDESLAKRIRIHANFAEYVPLALLLIAFLEAGGGASWLVRTLLVVLVIARILHPIGMLAPKNSPRQFACRGGGIIATLVVIIVTALVIIL